MNLHNYVSIIYKYYMQCTVPGCPVVHVHAGICSFASTFQTAKILFRLLLIGHFYAISNLNLQAHFSLIINFVSVDCDAMVVWL